MGGERPETSRRHSRSHPISEEDESPTEFAYERDLQSFLSKNLGLVEPRLHIYQDEGVTGVEIQAGAARSS